MTWGAFFCRTYSSMKDGKHEGCVLVVIEGGKGMRLVVSGKAGSIQHCPNIKHYTHPGMHELGAMPIMPPPRGEWTMLYVDVHAHGS